MITQQQQQVFFQGVILKWIKRVTCFYQLYCVFHFQMSLQAPEFLMDLSILAGGEIIAFILNYDVLNNLLMSFLSYSMYRRTVRRKILFEKVFKIE